MVYLISLDDRLFPGFDGTQEQVMNLIGASIVGQILEWGKDDVDKATEAEPWPFAEHLRVLDTCEPEADGPVKLLAWEVSGEYFFGDMTHRQAQVLEHVAKGIQDAIENGKEIPDPFQLE